MELVAFRLGTAKLAKMGINMDLGVDQDSGAYASPSAIPEHHVPHPHPHHAGEDDLIISGVGSGSGLGSGSGSGVGVGANSMTNNKTTTELDIEKGHDHSSSASASSTDPIPYADSQETESGAAQILGVATLEFGVVFHSIIIGLTLSLTDSAEFTTLFIVIIFHQMFEGLGLGE